MHKVPAENLSTSMIASSRTSAYRSASRSVLVACLSIAAFCAAGCMEKPPEKIEVVGAEAVGYTLAEKNLGNSEEMYGFYYSAYETAVGSDGPHLAYIAKRDKNVCVVRDGQAGKEYKSVSYLRFSKDAGHLAYIATAGEKMRLVLDSKEGPEFDDIAVQPDPTSVFRNYYSYSYSYSPYYYYYTPHILLISFPQDGKPLVYAGRLDKKWHVVVGEKMLPGFEGDLVGTPEVSPDGKHVMYVASQTWQSKAFPVEYQTKRYVFIDGKAVIECDKFMVGATFDKDGSIKFIAQRDGKMLDKLVLTPKPAGK